MIYIINVIYRLYFWLKLVLIYNILDNLYILAKMRNRSEFQKMNHDDKVLWISWFMNEFDTPKILELGKFWDISKNSLTDVALNNIYDIINREHQQFVNHSANLMSEYINNLQKQEKSELQANNPEDILATI